MKTRSLTLYFAVTMLLFGALNRVSAAATMRLSGDGGATWILVIDNGPLDVSTIPGLIVYNGPVGTWNVDVASAIGRPLAGTPARPTIDVNTFNYSLDSADLIVQMSDTDFTSLNVSQTYIARITGTTDGTVRMSTWRDNGNVLFGTTESYAGDPPGISPSPTAMPLTSQGPFSGGTFIDAASNTVPPQATVTYSVTLQTVVHHSSLGNTRTDALLFSPLVFTRCPNDVDLGCNPPIIPDCDTNEVTVDSPDPATLVISCTTSNFTNGCNYSRTITYTATDSSGYEATCVHTVKWKVDTNAPVFAPSQNKSFQCDVPWNFDTPSASDDCDQPIVTIDSTATNSLGCGYVATRVWRATDLCGNTSYSTQAVSVVDTIAPTINCSAPKNVECGSTWNFDAPSASDNCSTPTVQIVSTVTNGSGCNYTVTRTWRATDACGNTNDCSQTVTVEDTTPPTIQCQPDTTTTNCTPLVFCSYTQGGWGAPPNGNNPGALLAANFAAVYPNGVEIGKPGGSGFSAKFTSALAVQNYLPDGGTPGALDSDAVNPTSTSAGVFAAQVLALTLNVDFSAAGIIGSSSGALGDLVYLDPSSPMDGKTIKQILNAAEDLLGGGSVNGMTISSMNSLVDSLNNAFDNCQSTGWATAHFSIATCIVVTNSPTPPIVSDICDPHPLVTYQDSMSSNGCGSSLVRTWYVTDHCGNSNSCTQTVNITDNIPPTIQCSPNKAVECGTSWNFDSPAATDNSGTAPVITIVSTVTNGSGCQYTVTRTWRATDACGNTSDCSQVVTVHDSTPPVITCAAPKNVECGTAWSFNAPTATDNCSTPSVSIVGTVTNGTGCNVTITRTWKAVDACNNMSQCSQTVTVRDTTPPTITCLADTAITNCVPLIYCSYTQGGWGAPPNGNNPGALLASNFTKVYPAGYVEVGIAGVGGYSAKFTSALAVQNYLPDGGTPSKFTGDLVNPTTTPAGVFGAQVLALKLNVDFSAAGLTGGSAKIGNLIYSDPTSSLNGKTVSQILAIANTLLGGGTVRGVTISALNPIVDGLNQAFDNCDTTGWASSHFALSSCTVTNVASMPHVSDNCDPHPTVTYKESTTSNSCGITVIRTWYATDNCGNSNSCTQTLSSQDKIAPVINCSANKTVECGTAWTFNTPTATDNSGAAPTITVISTVTNGSGCQYTVTRTWQATDACGNSTQCSQTVTVRDTTPPVITCPPGGPSTNINFVCSYTPGGWGAPPNGNNVASVLANNFTKVYPGGYVEVGISGNAGDSLKFTSAYAIQVFLPNGGTPNVLTADATNPTSSPSGTFGQHVLALQLNIDFSDAGYIGGPTPLGDLVYTDPSSPLNGKTVRQILAIAETVLGGGTVSGVTPTTLQPLIQSINEGFDNCSPTGWAKTYLLPASSGSSGSVATATDNCTPAPTITSSDYITNVNCYGSYTVTRTWRATDNCGNSSTCSQVISYCGKPPKCVNAVCSSGSVKLNWPPCAGANSYTVKRGTSPAGPFSVVASGLTTTNYMQTKLVNGSVYYYVVCAVKSGSTTADSTAVPAIPGSTAPNPWKSADIGAVGIPGTTVYASPKFGITASGADIWNTADEFRYVYQTASGDCSLVARVVSLGNTDPWAKAGVMIRETLASNSRHAAVFMTPASGVAFQYRNATGGTSGNVNITGKVAPYWVKIVRSGSTFSVYYSATGSSWTLIGSQSITMSSSVYIGFAVTSHNDGVLCPAVIDSVTATP